MAGRRAAGLVHRDARFRTGTGVRGRARPPQDGRPFPITLSTQEQIGALLELLGASTGAAVPRTLEVS